MWTAGAHSSCCLLWIGFFWWWVVVLWCFVLCLVVVCYVFVLVWFWRGNMTGNKRWQKENRKIWLQNDAQSQFCFKNECVVTVICFSHTQLFPRSAMNRLSPSHNKDLKTDYVTDFFKAKLKSFTCLFCGDVVYAKVWLFIFLCKGRGTERRSPNCYRKREEAQSKRFENFLFQLKEQSGGSCCRDLIYIRSKDSLQPS